MGQFFGISYISETRSIFSGEKGVKQNFRIDIRNLRKRLTQNTLLAKFKFLKFTKNRARHTSTTVGFAENLYLGSPNFLRQSPVGNPGT